MTTRAAAEKLAYKYGTTLDIVDIVRLDVTVPSPDGKKWVESDAHVIVSSQGGGVTRKQVWRDVCEAMRGGLEDCTDAECDTCHPVDYEQ